MFQFQTLVLQGCGLWRMRVGESIPTAGGGKMGTEGRGGGGGGGGGVGGGSRWVGHVTSYKTKMLFLLRIKYH